MFEGVAGIGWSIIAIRFGKRGQKSVTAAPDSRGLVKRQPLDRCRKKTLKLFLGQVSEWWHDHELLGASRGRLHSLNWRSKSLVVEAEGLVT